MNIALLLAEIAGGILAVGALVALGIVLERRRQARNHFRAPLEMVRLPLRNNEAFPPRHPLTVTADIAHRTIGSGDQ